MELLLIALLFILHNLLVVTIYAVALIYVNLNICHNIAVVGKKNHLMHDNEANGMFQQSEIFK